MIRGVDKTLLTTIGLLMVIGLITLASASIALSERQFGYPFYYLYRQLALGVGFGLLLFYVGLRIPTNVLKKYAPWILIGSIAVLLLTFTPLGGSVKGASRWIFIGPLSFQPSELLKIAFVIYLSAWMSSKKKDMGDWRSGLMPFLLINGFVGWLLVKQPDFSTVLIVAGTALAMFFVAGARKSHIVLTVLLGLIVFSTVIFSSGYRTERVKTFLNPNLDIQNSGWQINQSLIAIGSGGIFGKGLGFSRQKFNYLPEPAGDAIFAIFAEEFGFLGVLVLLGIFIAFFIRGMMTAAGAKDQFSWLLASGITFLVIIQVIVNIGALSGILPLTGIPLPFISYGGTALAFLLFEMGILLQISKRSKA
ncbi:MAG: putative lipid II flippase FtsW [bacterium]|nr:putative lipid II flippase FtsW [bacterium]